MKKYIAIILAVATMSFLLASCTNKVKGGAAVTNAVGESVAIVTNPDGDLSRDSAGNAIILQTDKNGKNIKDENGKNATNPVALDHALVIGNKIEMNSFTFTIPDGWSDLGSHATCMVRRDSNTDQIEVRTFPGGNLTDTQTGCLKIYEQLKSAYGSKGGKFTEGTSKIDGIEASTYECFVSKEVSGADKVVYWSYFFFERGGTVYVIQISSSDNDLTGNREIAGILNSIKFY